MFPAKNGDCFLVSMGTDKKQHILIDCGYTETYNKFLKNELYNIARKNEAISLLVITHVDQDHILGALKLIEENNKHKFIHIEEIWHNSYRHLQFNKKKVKEITQEENQFLKTEIALGSSIVNRADNKSVKDSCLLQNKSAELCKEKMQRPALY
jgi:glyoxylase-like metal-dependent hydrolase (beta-lactamase superfamily II)